MFSGFYTSERTFEKLNIVELQPLLKPKTIIFLLTGAHKIRT